MKQIETNVTIRSMMCGLVLFLVPGLGVDEVVNDLYGAETEAKQEDGKQAKIKVPKVIQAAVKNEKRPGADRARDNDRKPGQVMSYAGIKPGMVVADLMAGGGYYSELLARVVGKDGKVYAQNNKIALQKFADRAMKKRLEGRDLDNVVRWDKELEELGLEENSLDAAFMVLFYHDTYWMKVDREKMNAQILEALKPGGVFIMIDHHAEKGSKDRDVKSLHRVDAEMVKQELLKAGFKLVGESELLRNKKDDRTINVFRPGMRGKTDRFLMKFVKPRKKG